MFNKGITRALLIVLIILCNLRGLVAFSSAVLCNRIPGLSQMQKQLCIENPDVVASIGAGHRNGAQECQHQFNGHRWNCSEVWKKDVFGHVISVGSREAAFTYAISSAGIVHAITAACARGNISICGCDQVHRNPNAYQNQHAWKWGGCSVDINFGMKFARKFLDVREIEGDARSQMNLHNNRAGRKIVKQLLKTECQCHGVSGSCSIKTCWKVLPPFRAVGDALMIKYNKARLVAAEKSQNGLNLIIKREIDLTKKKEPKKGKIGTQNRNKNTKEPKRMELVYLQQSPNYCERDHLSGSLGTHGRKCFKNSTGLDSCSILCCERGYNTYQIVKTEQCRCKFEWCCNVKCELCTERYEEYTCK